MQYGKGSHGSKMGKPTKKAKTTMKRVVKKVKKPKRKMY